MGGMFRNVSIADAEFVIVITHRRSVTVNTDRRNVDRKKIARALRQAAAKIERGEVRDESRSV